MSNPNIERFKSHYPKEYGLAEDIGTRSEKVFKSFIASSPNIGDQPVIISVSNHPSDPSRLSLGMNAQGKIFIGVMARAILESLTGELEGLLSGEIGKRVLDERIKEIVSKQLSAKGFKICPSCKSENLPKARYCDQCAKEL